MEQSEMSVDQINDAQGSALSALRERIKARQASVFAAEPESEPFPVAQFELVDVPQVTVPDEAEFSLERHAEIVFRLEALYNNYLYRLKEVTPNASSVYGAEQFDIALKELCRTQESLLKEGLKPRF